MTELALLTLGGTDTVTGTTTPYTHTLSEAADTLWFTLERYFSQLGSGVGEKAVDCKMGQFTLTGKNKGEIDFQVVFMAANDMDFTAAPTTTFDTNREAAFFQGAVVIKSGTTTLSLTPMAWKIDINNQPEEMYGAGAINPAWIGPKQRKVNGTCTASTENLTDIYIPLYGLSTSNPPTGTLMLGSFAVTITTGANANAAITLPSIAYTAAPPHLQPNGAWLEYEIAFTAMETSGNDEVTWVTTNTSVTQF